MCLEYVEETITLDQDLDCFKTVLREIRTGRLFCGLINTNAIITEIKEGINEIKNKSILKCDCSDDQYESGFHCNRSNRESHWSYNKVYLKSQEVKDFFNIEDRDYFPDLFKMYFEEITIKIKIPQGTRITYGKQNCLGVIVTPIFIL